MSGGDEKEGSALPVIRAGQAQAAGTSCIPQITTTTLLILIITT